jgi:hypothetical protein
MNRFKWKVCLAFIVVAIFVGLIPTTAYAASSPDVVIGNSYTLEGGKVLDDDLLIVGGSVNLLFNSVVNGNIILVGGSLDAAGIVNGDVTILGGAAKLENSLLLNGNLTTAGASVSREPEAKITGQIFTGENTPSIILPGGIRLDNLASNRNPIISVAGFFLRLFLWVMLAMVAALLIPIHLTRVTQTAFSEPLISWIFGLLTAIVVPIVMVLIAFTICLIPISILGLFLLAIAWAFGLIALGFELGKRISALFKQEWHPVITAGAGTLVLMTILNGLEALIPCVGLAPKVLIGLLGLGAVLLTQFGIKPYTSKPNLPRQSPTGALPV